MTSVFVLIVQISIMMLPANANSQSMEFGLNGHPFAQIVYKNISIQKQLDLVKESGAKWYRVDCYGASIEPQQMSKIKELVYEAKKRGLKILPCIFPPLNISKEDDLDKIYKISYEFSKKIVSELKYDVHVWELHNELDNIAIVKKDELSYLGTLWKSGIPDGSKIEHFESTRIKKVMAMLKGMSNGVYAADPNADRIINGTYIHYGLIEHALINEINFEIIGWHWYSDMGNITKVKGNIDLLERLKKYNKPIWITEINKRGGSKGADGENEQYIYLKDTLKAYLNYAKKYNVQKLIIYELLDEPQFGANNPESFYGLVKVHKNNVGSWEIFEKKKSFNVIKDISQ